ncbi:peptidoglycan glycosyltransferase FtsW [Microbacterium indicum]|uniref:peptidoglycan glycosyltransferase FtsW n=1 Tax=Microbacterium indicum TaxID=358100 RepID=UPI00040C682F|nr:putative peptidoglycan glycosyltransferase FtsW [Microbacterium indicum]
MTSDQRPPKRAERGGLAARISLGSGQGPASVEYLLILGTSILLTAFGVVMVFSATTVRSVEAGSGPLGDGLSHLVYAAVGIPIMLIVSRFSLAWLRRIAWPVLIVALALQALVFTPLGYGSGGNRNWLSLGVISIQPSEFLKLALALWCALILWRKRDRFGTFWQVWIPLVPGALLTMAAVMLGDDLGTTMIYVLVLIGAMFFGGVRGWHIAPILGGGALGIGLLAVFSPNRLNRILSVYQGNCLEDYLSTCYQPLHAIWGLADGGVFGVGLGNSKEKYNWLPAASDDYIFAIIGEELGLVGCVVVLALFAILAVAIFRMIRRTDDVYIRAAAGGIGMWLIGQALINIGVVLRVFPALGVPLPFLSRGGSSLIAVLVGCGVLLALARRIPNTAAVDAAAAVQTPAHKIVR